MRVILLFFITLTFSITASCDENSPNSKGFLQVTQVASDDTLNMRLAANSKSAVVYQLPFDATNLIQVSRSGKWIQVSYRDYVGWVYEKYVTPVQPATSRSVIGQELRCFGTEPHWTLQTQGHQISFGEYGETTSFTLNDKVRQGTNHNNLWLANFIDPDNPFQSYKAIIEKSTCSDDMSDKKHPFAIKIINSHGQLFSGCCASKN